MDDVLALEFVEDVRITDDRVAVRAGRVGRLEQAPAGALARIIVAHRDLAADHVQFLCQLIGRQRRVLEDVAKDVDGHDRAVIGHIDVIHRAIEGRVGVHVPAGLLHLLINAPGATFLGAFEKHVLENVGEARAHPCAFVDAAGAAPSLRGDDRRGVILAHDDGQTILQRNQPSVGLPVCGCGCQCHARA